MKCLCPVYQKFYSSLNLISFISVDNNFFDNISYLDSFFNEFRNITFVLQKQIGDNEKEKKIYDALLDKYLIGEDLKWLKETRNIVLKEKPFGLSKKIHVDIYYVHGSETKLDFSFSFNTNDMNSTQIIDKIKEEFSKIETTQPEFFFTIKYSFTSEENEIDIFNKITTGINCISSFIRDFEENIDINCDVCSALKQNISKKINDLNAKIMKFTEDGSFNTKTKKIEFSDRAEIFCNDGELLLSPNKRIPLEKDNLILKGNCLEERFKSFIINHILIYKLQHQSIIPTFIIFYNDKTFSIESIFVFNKATVYRKINEIASRIETDNIVSIFMVFEMNSYNLDNKDIFSLTHLERQKYIEEESLAFSMVTNTLDEKHIMFNSDKISDLKYVRSLIRNFNSNFENLMLLPIIKIFKELRDEKNDKKI